ncbi:zf-TFIIB domain-containing protein [Mariniblastus sp.]|nr:zf-TFIIB domain-containing protein [Mariniblastus sp.]
MNCDTCSSVMLPVYGQSHHECRGCNTFSFPTELDQTDEPITATGKKTGFNCPRCAVELEVGLMVDTVQVCFCNNCRGYVIDNDTFGNLAIALRDGYKGADDKPKPIDPKQLETSQNCPACFAKMEAHPYYGPGSVVIDSCTHCKLAWLDHGELGRIVRAPGRRAGSRYG